MGFMGTKESRIIILKEKTFAVDEDRTISKEGRTFFVEDISKDFHTEYGIISKEDLKKKDGTSINLKGREFVIFSPSYIDNYKRIKRLPQIISLKDAGYILAETGLNKDSIVLEAGTGSGALTCFLAEHVKKVISYEIEKEHIKITEENIKKLGLKNIIIKNKNIYESIEKSDYGNDAVILDLPEPEKAIANAEKALKIGGFFVVYVPNITQSIKFVNEIRKNESFIYLKTIELIENSWKIKGLVAKPENTGIHTGFLSFARRIK